MTGPLAFDDNGELVEITDFQFRDDDASEPSTNDARRIQRETVMRLVDFLAGEPGRSAEEAGRGLLTLALLLDVPSAAPSQKALAESFGVSEAAVSLRLSRLREKMSESKVI